MHTEDSAVRGVAISHGYPTHGREVSALRAVDVAAPKGRITALVGPSGSGKSTLLRILACLDRPQHGAVEIAGIEVTGMSTRQRRALRRKHIGYVYQDPADNLLPYLTVTEHLKLAAQLRRSKEDGEEILDVLGLRDRAGHHPRQLSGGEQQRVALAFAAVGSPTVVVADEPTAQLDRTSGRKVIHALRQLADAGRTVLVATHDPEVDDTADRVIELIDGHAELTR